VFYNVLKRDDSGQAGMTSKEGYSIFYEIIINKKATELIFRGLGVFMFYLFIKN